MKTEHILLGITGAVLVGGILMYVRSRQTSPTPVNSGGGTTNPVITKPVINNPILKFPTVTSPVTTNPVVTKPTVTNPILQTPTTTTEKIFARNGEYETLLAYRGSIAGFNSNFLR